MTKTTSYEFGSIGGLEEAANEISERFDVQKRQGKDSAVLCKFNDGNEWCEDYSRAPLAMMKDGEITSAAAVSKRDKYYEPINFETPLHDLATAIESHDDLGGISGEITIKGAQKMGATVNLAGVEAIDATGSALDLELRLRTAHTGFHAVKAELGAERLVCSNGMTRWVPEEDWSHGHNDGPFNAAILHQALDAAVESPEVIRRRTEKAHEQQFESFEEALLALRYIGNGLTLYDILDEDPHETLKESLREEAEKSPPSLYDTYNAATHAVSHSDNLSDFQVQTGLELASELVMDDFGSVHDTGTIGESAVNFAVQRANTLSQQDDPNEAFDGEIEELTNLVTAV